MQKTVYCTCGKSFTAKGKSSELESQVEMWRTWNYHRREGHALCDRKTAMLAKKALLRAADEAEKGDNL